MRGTRVLVMLGWSALSALGCAAAYANDSTAELSIGGLVFTKSTDISMESEELTIATDQVSVRYVFLKQSQNPVTVTVAFPPPDIDLAEADNYAIPSADPVNFVGFQTKMDGRPVNFSVSQRAFLGEKDGAAGIKPGGLPI